MRIAPKVAPLRHPDKRKNDRDFNYFSVTRDAELNWDTFSSSWTISG